MKTFSDVLTDAASPVIVLDDQGIVTSINDAFKNEYGWRDEDLLGRSVSIIIPPALRQAHHVGFSRFLSTETPTLLSKPIQLPIVCQNGQERTVEHCIVAEKLDGKWRFAATIRP